MGTELRQAVQECDWAALHAEGKTRFLVESSWIASEERCEVLRRLCAKHQATRVLEVGAFCGLASIAMAETLPETGEVVALEIDPYLAEFGQQFLDKSEHGTKVKYTIGRALDSLKEIAKSCADGSIAPFDFLVIDADRASLMDYFKLFWYESPHMLADQATVCIDITPYKGQEAIRTRGPSCGDLQGDLWVVPSGQDQIDTLRRTLEASTEHSVYKVAGLLVSHKKENEDGAISNVTTPRLGMRPSLSHGANPLASFPNDHMKAILAARWVAPTPSDQVGHLRSLVKSTDWGTLYADGKTMTRVDPLWLGSEERCAVLRNLVSSAKAQRVLEIGGFCGVSSLSMAEVLPDNGQITSLELDPFLAQFSEDAREKSPVGHKINYIVGSAVTSLQRFAQEASASSDSGAVKFDPFDFVVIDADRDNVNDYFDTVWNAPGLLAQGATVCVDVQPYKGQAPVRYVKHGKAPEADQWILPAGQDKINALKASLEASSKFSFYKVGGLLVVNASGQSDLAS